MDTPTTDRFLSECHYNGQDFEDNFHASIEYGRKLERLLRRLQQLVNEAFVATPELGSGERFEATRAMNELLK